MLSTTDISVPLGQPHLGSKDICASAKAYQPVTWDRRAQTCTFNYWEELTLGKDAKGYTGPEEDPVVYLTGSFVNWAEYLPMTQHTVDTHEIDGGRAHAYHSITLPMSQLKSGMDPWEGSDGKIYYKFIVPPNDWRLLSGAPIIRDAVGHVNHFLTLEALKCNSQQPDKSKSKPTPMKSTENSDLDPMNHVLGVLTQQRPMQLSPRRLDQGELDSWLDQLVQRSVDSFLALDGDSGRGACPRDNCQVNGSMQVTGNPDDRIVTKGREAGVEIILPNATSPEPANDVAPNHIITEATSIAAEAAWPKEDRVKVQDDVEEAAATTDVSTPFLTPMAQRTPDQQAIAAGSTDDARNALEGASSEEENLVAPATPDETKPLLASTCEPLDSKKREDCLCLSVRASHIDGVEEDMLRIDDGDKDPEDCAKPLLSQSSIAQPRDYGSGAAVPPLHSSNDPAPISPRNTQPTPSSEPDQSTFGFAGILLSGIRQGPVMAWSLLRGGARSLGCTIL